MSFPPRHQSEGSGSTPAVAASAIEAASRLGCLSGGAAVGAKNVAKKGKKRQYPADVPDAVKRSIDAYKVQEEFEFFPFPSRSQRSIIYNWGVRMVRKSVVIDKAGNVSQFWICLASHKGRMNNELMAISSAQTSNATQHNSLVHNLKSDKSKAMKRT